jgi:hypothetical protein
MMTPKQIGALGAVIAGVVALHGVTSKKWQDAHTIGVALGLLATLASGLES